LIGDEIMLLGLSHVLQPNDPGELLIVF